MRTESARASHAFAIAVPCSLLFLIHVFRQNGIGAVLREASAWSDTLGSTTHNSFNYCAMPLFAIGDIELAGPDAPGTAIASSYTLRDAGTDG
jgi:hypothetical protein